MCVCVYINVYVVVTSSWENTVKYTAKENDKESDISILA